MHCNLQTHYHIKYSSNDDDKPFHQSYRDSKVCFDDLRVNLQKTF